MDERKPLINQRVGSDHPPVKKIYSRRDVCQFVSLGLGTAAFASAIIVYATVSAQYIYNRVAKEYSLNESVVNTAKSPCLSDNISTNESKKLNNIQSVATQWNLLSSLCYSIPCACVTLLFGVQTDKYGRKPFIVISTVCGFFRALSMLATVWWNLPLYVIVIGAVIDGLGGSFFMFFVASLSSIADMTPPGQTRTFAIAVIQCVAASTSGLILIGSGYFIMNTGFFYPCLTIVLMYVLALFVEFILIKETLRKQKDVVPMKQRFLALLSLYTHDNGHRLIYVVCIMTFFLQGVCFIGRGSVTTLFALNQPFCFTTIQIGFLSCASFLIPEFCGIFLLKILQRCLPDSIIVLFSILSAAGSMVLQALATMDYELYLTPVAGVMGLLVFPLVRGIMSHITDQKHQGALFGSIGAVETLANVCSSFLLNFIYQQTVSVYPPTVFFVITGIYGCMFLLFLVVVFRKTAPTNILEVKDKELENSFSLKD